MASIQSLGVGSGLLTSELVEDIIAAEREATDLRLDAKRAEFEARISAFGALRSAVDQVVSTSGAISTADEFLVNNAVSSNEAAVTATVDGTATPALHTVEVLATARAHTLTSQRYDAVDAVVGEGTIDVRFGTTTFVAGNYDSFSENAERASAQIVIDSSNNTLTGVRDAINAAGSGVVASIVDDGQGFVLVLTSDQTGEANSMELTVTESGDPGLSALAFNATANTPGTNLTQTVDADDTIAVIDGITVTRETNTITNVIDGVTFNVIGNNAGAPATVTVNQDVNAIRGQVDAFISAFNELQSLTSELTDFDEDAGSGALLIGDSTVRNLLAQVRRFLSRTVEQVDSNSLRALVDVGITTDQNAGFALRLDAAKFTSALTADAAAVTAVLAAQTRASDAQVSFLAFQDVTQAGEYTVDITALATQAALVGATTAGLAGAVTIDDDNDTLQLTVNGTSTGVITLAQGTYADGDAVAQEIESQINQDSALRAADASVTVSYDSDNQQLVLSSNQFGSSSNIGILAVDTDSTAELGLALSSAASNVGTDVAGTINGIEGQGTGQILSLSSGPQPATAGVYNGAAVTSFDALPFTVDDSNDRFRISVDGLTSSDVLLTRGDYASAAALATEIQTQINADSNFSLTERTVNVLWDAADQRFEISSGTKGPASTVAITFASAGVVSDLGLSVGAGLRGTEASEDTDPAAGIQLLIQGTKLGERGTVTLARGVMNQLETFLSEFIGPDGALTSKVASLDEQVTDVDEEAADFSTRMELLEERLRFQFAAADALISTLNSTSDFLTQQLSSLPGFSSDN